MKSRVAMLVAVAALVCSSGVCQERLSDVAGTITLNPEAIVEKQGVVVDPNAAIKADHQLFGSILESCAALADSVGDMVEEARASILYRDDVLPKRLTAATLDLDTELQGLNLLRLSPEFSEPLETAVTAIDVCGVGTDSVREELARKGVAFTQAREDMTLCRRELHEAERQLAAVAGGRQPGPAQARPGDEETPSDDEIIEERCAPERTKGPDPYEACTGRQYRALANLNSRTADNEMLDPAVFSGIRELCAELHRDDFETRDRCELDKMTSARLELE